MLECLADLRRALGARGGALVVRRGPPERELPAPGARGRAPTRLHFTRRPLALRPRARRARVPGRREARLELRRIPGSRWSTTSARCARKRRQPYTVFSPFHRAWLESRAGERAGARPIAAGPAGGLRRGALPTLDDARPRAGGRRADARRRAARPAERLAALPRRGRRAPTPTTTTRSARDSTSRLSPYLHFGCVSPREVEERLPRGRGPGGLPPPALLARLLPPRPAATSRTTRHAEFQERYRGAIDWSRATTSTSRPGARAAPASRSSTPACASSAARAGCTTAPGSSSAPS